MHQRNDRPPVISGDLLATYRAELKDDSTPCTIDFYLQAVGELGRVIEERGASVAPPPASPDRGRPF
jgi:hypothetical protein